MEPILSFSTVSEGIKTVQALRNFVRNELGKLLQQLGDAQSKEAIKSLSRSAESKSKKNETSNIREAAGFLRHAKINYLIAARSNPMKTSASEPVLSWWYGSILNTPRFLAYQKAYKALILAAICYKYIDALPDMEGTLEEAQEIFDEYQKKYDPQLLRGAVYR